MPRTCCRGGAKDGQSLVESCIVILLIALIFAGLFQISQLFAAREVLYYAAACGARAKTVGLNWWMVEKSIRVAAIPNAGRLIVPPFQNQDATLTPLLTTLKPGTLWERVLGIVPASQQLAMEKARIPDYLDSFNNARGDFLLDYAEWDSIRGDHDSVAPADGVIDPIVRVRVGQDYPLRIAGHGAFYSADSIPLHGESSIENYYPLYIDDMCW